MKRSTVTLGELSGLAHEVELPETAPYQIPAFKVISYHDEFRHGSCDRANALSTTSEQAYYRRIK